MVKFLAGAFLVARVACQRLDVSFELALEIWRSRPVIEVVLKQPQRCRAALLSRLDALFPF